MSSSTNFVVVDTSVLLAAGPQVLTSYGDATLVLSSVVIAELESKRTVPDEVGYQARRCLRAIDDITRAAAGNLRGPYPVNDAGGTLLIEMNHREQLALPETMRDPKSNDMRILSIAAALKQEHSEATVTVLSRDLPLRLHARLELGLLDADYTGDQAKSTGWTGIENLDIPQHLIDELHNERALDIADDPTYAEIKALPVNTGVIAHGALARVVEPGVLRKINPKQKAFGLEGKSAEQRIALDLLLDDDVPIVSLGGRAGTGKTILAIAAGLQKVIEERKQKKVIVFRNLHAVGGQELGYLPGSAEEKMDPWAQAIYDALGAFCGEEILKHIAEQKLLEVQPLTHIRGRTLHDAYVVVDESQNLELATLSTTMTRIAETSKIVLTHDVAQRDNLRVGRYDGIAAVMDKLKGSPLFAHVTLVRSERSRAAELVSNLLDAE